MIDWLNDNSGAVQGISAVILVGVTSVLVAVTAWYARETRRIAKSTADQARASHDIVRATLVPVLEQYVAGQEMVSGSQSETAVHYYRVDFKYWNIGTGPAINIRWSLDPECGRFIEPPQRVGMSVGDGKGDLRVALRLPLPAQFALSAEYRDVLGRSWRSQLQIVKNSQGTFDNGESAHERTT